MLALKMTLTSSSWGGSSLAKEVKQVMEPRHLANDRTDGEERNPS